MLHATQGVLLLAAYAPTSLLIFSGLTSNLVSFAEHNLGAGGISIGIMFMPSVSLCKSLVVNLELCLYFFHQ